MSKYVDYAEYYDFEHDTKIDPQNQIQKSEIRFEEFDQTGTLIRERTYRWICATPSGMNCNYCWKRPVLKCWRFTEASQELFASWEYLPIHLNPEVYPLDAANACLSHPESGEKCSESLRVGLFSLDFGSFVQLERFCFDLGSLRDWLTLSKAQ